MDNDFLQAFREIIREEVRGIVKEEITSEMKEVKERLATIENKVDTIENKVDTIENKVDTIENKVDTIENKVIETNLIIENEIVPSIKFIAEGHRGLVSRLDRIEDKVDDMGATVLALDVIHTKI